MGVEVEGVVASDYAATVEALGAGQSDAIITDAGSLYNAMEQHNAELILRDVRFGATTYASVAYTNDPDKYCEDRSEEHTSELQSRFDLVCRLLLEKKKTEKNSPRNRHGQSSTL